MCVWLFITHTEMEDAYCNSNQTVVGATSLKYLYDIREWIAPCIETININTTQALTSFNLERILVAKQKCITSTGQQMHGCPRMVLNC